jgi:hypothetical protein
MVHVPHETPSESYTIAGEKFDILQPYRAGLTLTEGEASQLNQVLAENVRNNRAKRITELKESGAFDHASVQAEIHDYVHTYEFGVRTGGGGRVSDPVEAIALELAKSKVKEAIVKAGGKLASFKAAEITAKAKEAIAANPKFMEVARMQVEALADEPAPKGKKAAA